MKRWLVFGLLAAVIAGVGGAVFYGLHTRSPDEGAPLPAAPVPPRVETERRYAAERTLAYRAPLHRSMVVETFPAGAPIDVGKERIGGDGATWRKTKGGGFVAEADLVDSVPTAAGELERARQELREGALTAAMSRARRAVVLDPGLREGWDILAGGFDAMGDVGDAREAYEKRAALTAPPSPDEPPGWPAPAPKERRYVDATTLRVHKAGSAKSRTLTRLRLNQSVEVLKVSGDFAEIRWLPESNPVWVVDVARPGEARRVDGPATPQKGFVPAAHLSPAPATLESLAARQRAAEEKGDPLGATRALERAVALSNADPGLVRLLMHAATDSRQYALAAVQAKRLGPKGSDAARPPDRTQTMEVLFGCEQPPPVDVEAACRREVDVLAACGACNAEEAEGAGPPSPWAPDAVQAAAREARARFPSGPWFHAVVLGDAALALEGRRPFAFAVPFEPHFSCGTDGSEVKLDAAKLWAPAGPWPGKDVKLELWLTGAGYQNVHFGVVPATSETEARALLAEAVQSATPRDPRVPVVTGPWQQCDCCEMTDNVGELGD